MKKRIISAVLSAAMLGTSVFSVPFVNATVVETYNIQVKPILNEFINENYKGDAELHDIYDGLIEVVFRKTELDEPKFDAEAIRSEFDKLFEEKNIDPATVEVVFLKPDKAPKTTDDNGRIKKLLESFIDQNYHDRARICGVGEDDDAIYDVIFNTDFSLDSKAMNDIWNDFEKLLKENDIDPKLVQVCFDENLAVDPASVDKDTVQIRKLLETFIEQNYKGEAMVAGGSECVEVLLFGNTPEFDGEVITNDFNQFLSENNIEPSLISFKVLEGVVVASVNTGDVDLNGTIDSAASESIFMSEFLEKSLSEIEDILQEKGLKKIVANHDIVIRLTSKQIKQIITELEPYKEELTPKNPEETYEINVKRKKAFIDLLFDKLHLKGVYSYIDPEYQYVRLPWNAEDLFDLDLTTKTADVDGSTVEIPNGYSITITISDNPEGYGFNNGDSKSLTNYEVGQRMLYVINTYGDKDYYDEVYVPLPSKATRFALGDVDLNDIIDVSDLTELSLALIGDKELTADQQKYSDIDGDGAVTLADLARLQQYLSKKITSF